MNQDIVELIPIEFKCPHCGETNSFTNVEAGSAQDCPFCLGTIVIPPESTEVGGIVPIPFKSQRLILRRLQPADAADVIAAAEDPSHPPDSVRVDHWLEADQLVRLTQTEQPFYLAVELVAHGKFIGQVSIKFSDDSHRQAEIGIMIAPQFRRHGYGTEALRALLDFAFRGIGLRRVTVWCDAQDVAAMRTLEKVGMRQEGEFLQDRWDSDGKWADTAYFALLKDEYQG